MAFVNFLRIPLIPYWGETRIEKIQKNTNRIKDKGYL